MKQIIKNSSLNRKQFLLTLLLAFLFISFNSYSQIPAGPGCPDVLDQQVTSSNSGSAGVDQWQSFTAGISGKLTKIEYMTNTCAAYNYTLTVYAGQGTGGAVLFSSAFNNPGVCNNWFATVIPIGSAPIVSAASQYTFRIQASASALDIVHTGNVYAGGVYFSNDYGLQNNWDLNFKTYVQQTAYPPASITAGGPTTFCGGGNVILSATSGTFSYQWYNGAATIGGATGLNYNVNTPGGYAAVVTDNGTNCWNVSNQINVNVLPTPTANATNIAVCQGSPGVLNATAVGGTPTYAFNWYDAPTGGNLLSNTSSLNTNPLDPPGTYLFFPEVTDANGCISSRPPINVTVNAPPTITITGGPIACNGGTATLTASGAVSYTWTPGGLTGANQTLTAGTYTISGIDGNGCTNSTTHNLTEPTPLTGFYTGSNITCGGVPLNITLNGGGGTVPYSFQWITSDNPVTSGESTTTVSNGLIDDIITNPSLSQQNLTYTVSVTDNNLCVATHTIFVSVDPLPSVTSTVSSAICSGSAVGYPLATDIAGSTFNWFANANANISGESTSNQISSTITDVLGNATFSPHLVTYNVFAVSPAGCAGPTQAININVNPIPTITSSNSVGICSGTSPNYNITSSVAGTTYSWVASDNPNTSGENLTTQTTALIDDILTSSSAAAQNVSYTITPTAASCVGTGFVFITSVNPVPAMISSNSAGICSGNAVNLNLSASIPSTFNWIAADNPNTSGESIIVQNTSLISDNINTSSLTSQTVSYSVTPTATTGGCPGPLQVVNVTVNPLPTMTSATFTTICSGDAINLALSSDIASSYSWFAADNPNTSGESTSPQNLSLISNTLVSSNAFSPENVLYSITPTSSMGCVGSVQSVTVNINPAPAITSPATATVCSGVSLSFPFGVTVPSNYSWNAADNPNTTGESTTAQTTGLLNDNISSTSSVAETVLYTVSAVSSNGCIGASQTLTVTVNPAPVITSSNTSTICTGNPVNLSITANIGSSFSWTASDNPNTSGESTGSQSSSLINDIINSVSSTPEIITYSVVPTSGGGCSGSQQIVSVTVNPNPALPTAAGVSICDGNTATLTATAPGGTYNWFPVASGGTSLFTGAIYNTPALNSNATYYVESTISGCTSARTAVTVTVNPNPSFSINAPASICTGQDLNLGISGLTGGSVFNYNWSGPGSFNSPLPNPIRTAVVLAFGGSYTLNITNEFGCIGSDVLAINVLPSPSAHITGGPTVICANETANLSGATSTANGDVISSYQWILGSSAITGATTVSYTTNTAGAYYLAVQNSNGCSDTSLVSPLVVNAIPASVITGSTAFCSGSFFSLSGSSSSPGGSSSFSSFEWMNSGSTVGGTTMNEVFTTAGNYELVITNSDGCKDTSAVFTVVENFPPAAPVLTFSGVSYCMGDSVYASVSNYASTNTYSWSVSPASLSISNPLDTGTYIRGESAGVFQVSVSTTDLSGCSSISPFTSLTVNSIPVVSTSNPSNDSICYGGSVAVGILNGGMSLYEWTSSYGQTINSAVPTFSNITQTGIVSFYAAVTDASGCRSLYDTVSVEVFSLPVVSAGSNSTVCEGTPVTLSASGSAATYSWSGGVVDGTPFFPVSTLSYTVTATNAAGCSDTASVLITVNAAPTVNGGNDASVCAGGTVTLTGTGTAGSYVWNNGISNGIAFTPAGTANYVVTGTGTNGCSKNDTVVVTVHSLPSVGISASSTSVCSGGSLMLSGTGAISYVWSGGITDNVSFVPSSTQTYTVTGTDANSCSNTASQLITVNALPSITASNATGSICPGSTASLNASGGNTYNWSDGQSGSAITVSPAASTTYTVTGTDLNGCAGTAVVTVNLLSQPPTPVPSVNNSSVCAGNSVLLSSSSASGNNWFNVSTLASMGNLQSFNHSEASAGSYSYGLFVFPSGGCSSDTAYISVVFNPCLSTLNSEYIFISANSSSSGNIFTNDGNPSGFVVTTSPILNTSNGSFSISASGAFNYSPNSGYSGPDIAVVQACSSSNCINDTIYFVISPLATNDAGTVSGLIAGSQLTGNVLVNDIGTGIGNGASLVADVQNGTLTLSSNGDFIYTPNSGYCGNDVFTYQVCDSYNLCTNASCNIIVTCEVTLQVFNSFSPNNDGKNDWWAIGNINLTENKVSIYDRWGNEIWKGDNYDNSSIVWKGENKNGEALPSGTYFYVIEVKDQQAQRGWIEITK